MVRSQALGSREQLKRYSIFLFWGAYLLVLFTRNLPASARPPLYDKVTESISTAIGVNNFGWSMFSPGNGYQNNMLLRLRFTTLEGRQYREMLVDDHIGYLPSAWNEFSYKLLNGDRRIVEGYLTWYCRNGYNELPLQSVTIEQAFVPLADWAAQNQQYLAQPEYSDVARVVCDSQS